MDSPEQEKKTDVRRPMNAFLIFCKRHRSMVREKNPDLDNRSVTRILGDLWANLGEIEKSVYTTLAKQYKDAFMKANPDYKWHNPDKTHTTPTKMTTRPTNARVVKSAQDIHLDGAIMPGKLADPSKMGGLSLLLMAGQQSMTPKHAETDRRVMSPDKCSSSKSALLELAEMCANELQHEETTLPHPKKHTIKTEGSKKGKGVPKKQLWSGDPEVMKARSKSESDSNIRPGEQARAHQPLVDIFKLVQAVKDQDAKISCSKEPLAVKPERREEQGQYGWGKVVSNMSGSVTDESLGGRSAARMSDRPAPRIRSWSESAKEDHSQCFGDDIGDHSGYTMVKSKNDAKSRRMSHSETLAGCLSDQNDNAIVSCGKLVVDHIVEKLFSTEIAQAAMKLKGVASVEELKKALMTGGFPDSKSLTGEGSQEGKLVNSRIERLVAEVYAKEKSETETKERDVVKKEYEPILRVPDVKSFLETNESNQKRSFSESVSSEGNCEVKAKKQMMTLPLEEVKSEPVDSSSVSTPEAKGDKSDQDYACDEEGRDRDDNGAYQPVRKSRRRNRGQRYLELINEGIIQPSKERLAARRAEQTSTEDESLWCYEDMMTEEDVQEVRRPAPKRSGSDSDAQVDEKKYKTGDFDLEAQIATLPACSLDPVSRGNRQKNALGKIRHHSEGSCKKSATVTSPTLAITDITTLALPPHVKMQIEPAPAQSVSGSRKRKARKHSINHLLPASGHSEEKGNDMDKNEETKSENENDPENQTNVTITSHSDVREAESQESGSPWKESISSDQKNGDQKSGDMSDQSDANSWSCDAAGLGNQVRQGLQDKVEISMKSEGGVSKFGCDISQSASGSLAQAASPSQSGTVSQVGVTQMEFKEESSDKGCDKNANINTSESDVLDFRTSKLLQTSSVGTEIARVARCRSNSAEVAISESSSLQAIQSNTEPMQSQTPMKLSGSCNLSEVNNSSANTEQEVNLGAARGGNSYQGQVLLPEASESQSDSFDSQEGFKSADSVTPPTASSEGQNEVNPVIISPREACIASDMNPCGPTSPAAPTTRTSETFPSSSSSVNFVAFSSASAPSTVDLVTLTSTAVTQAVNQAVNLEVLAERADDSPTSSITRSPLAAGSPSVGVVHS